MSGGVFSDGPTHRRAKWRGVGTASARPCWRCRRWAAVLLRSSCGHVLGVGIVGKRQRFVAWKRCS